MKKTVLTLTGLIFSFALAPAEANQAADQLPFTLAPRINLQLEQLELETEMRFAQRIAKLPRPLREKMIRQDLACEKPLR